MSDAPKVGDVVVMVGTKKGSFLFWSDPARKQWQRNQHHKGWMVGPPPGPRSAGQLDLRGH